MKMIEFEFYDETIFLSFGRFENGSLWLDSDYFSERFILNLNVSQIADVELKLNSTHTAEAMLVEILEEQVFNKTFIIFVSMLKTRKRIHKEISMTLTRKWTKSGKSVAKNGALKVEVVKSGARLRRANE